MAKSVECFYPGGSFPAISVTGKSCSLDCKHCSRKYLEGMIPAQNCDELIDVAEALAERGAKGFLLSGGADSSGRVPLSEMLPAIREIKATTDLKINAHIGLTSREEIRELVKGGIDAFSVDVYGSDETIRDVLGLQGRAQDYIEVVKALHEAGAPMVAPHICVGVHAGNIDGEHRAIDMLKESPPKELILISLIPTAGTAYAGVSPPARDGVMSVVVRARSALPETKILLGCMRSRKDRSWEFDLVAAGLDGIVMPLTSTVDRLRKEGFTIKKRSVCCAIP